MKHEEYIQLFTGWRIFNTINVWYLPKLRWIARCITPM